MYEYFILRLLVGTVQDHVCNVWTAAALRRFLFLCRSVVLPGDIPRCSRCFPRGSLLSSLACLNDRVPACNPELQPLRSGWTPVCGSSVSLSSSRLLPHTHTHTLRWLIADASFLPAKASTPPVGCILRGFATDSGFVLRKWSPGGFSKEFQTGCQALLPSQPFKVTLKWKKVFSNCSKSVYDDVQHAGRFSKVFHLLDYSLPPKDTLYN